MEDMKSLQIERVKMILNGRYFPSDFINGVVVPFIKRQKNQMLIISDCDGILTDARSVYSESGKMFKTYGAYDTEMLDVLNALDIKVEFYSSDKEGFRIHQARIQNHLKCSLVFGGAKERIQHIKDVKKTTNQKVLYIGDSLTDVTVGLEADSFYTVSNAPSFVKKHSKYASNLVGGYGAFADIILYILKHER